MRTKDCRPRDYGNLMGKFTLCGPVQFRFNITFIYLRHGGTWLISDLIIDPRTEDELELERLELERTNLDAR